MANAGEHSHMAKRMLIDATHSQESRVAIVDGSTLSDYDAETSAKKQYKGNVYLAKIIRIEPSLQAAFVEYGQNRHGFLPFAEIHPDYYRIPVGDRLPESDHSEAEERSLPPFEETSMGTLPAEEIESPQIDATQPGAEVSLEIAQGVDETTHPTEVAVGIEGDGDEPAPQRPRSYRYKIQEVIKRRQIVLVQVVKEERGNKGAALTTYLSLPGRYCVLMPNAGHRSGGISRKISDVVDRKRLRTILDDLPIPEGINLIVRTAGQDRNKVEIRRDYEYLIRLWAEIREKTLTSIAPALIYAEGDLIKRSIRDNYDKEINEIIVEGEDGYKAAKIFMKNLIPSHAKRVKLYKETQPLFQRYGVETQIDEIMSPVAQLPSGGSIVINSTEALVAIDVNSGKSTRERHIAETALKTNLEAADEVARQMRLRDLGGLLVIDFIDMDDQKHIQTVEKRLKEAVRFDRARIQVGRISQFGLLELSRQRLRPSIIESNMRACTHCQGTGLVRSVESSALFVLRGIESIGIEGKSAEIVVTVPAGIDLYLLNQKRSNIISLESRYQMRIQIQRDETLVPPHYHIDILVGRDTPLKFIEHAAEMSLPPQKSLPHLENKTLEVDSDEMNDTAEERSSAEGEKRSGNRSNRSRKNPYQNWRKNRPDNRRKSGFEGDSSSSGMEESSGETGGRKEQEAVSQQPPAPQTADQEGSVPKKDNQRRRNNRRRSRRPASQEGAIEAGSGEKKENNTPSPSPQPPVVTQPGAASDPSSPTQGQNQGRREGRSRSRSRRGNSPRTGEGRNEESAPPQGQKQKESGTSTVTVLPTPTPDASKGTGPKASNDRKEGLAQEMITTSQAPKKKRGFWSRLLDA